MSTRGRGFKFDVLVWEDRTRYPIKLDRASGKFSIQIDRENVFSGKDLEQVKEEAKKYLKANLGLDWKPVISIDVRGDYCGARSSGRHVIALKYDRAFIATNKNGELLACDFDAKSDDALEGAIGQKTNAYEFNGKDSSKTVIPYTPEKWSALRLITRGIEVIEARIKEALDTTLKAENSLEKIAQGGMDRLIGFSKEKS